MRVVLLLISSHRLGFRDVPQPVLEKFVERLQREKEERERSGALTGSAPTTYTSTVQHSVTTSTYSSSTGTAAPQTHTVTEERKYSNIPRTVEPVLEEDAENEQSFSSSTGAGHGLSSSRNNGNQSLSASMTSIPIHNSYAPTLSPTRSSHSQTDDALHRVSYDADEYETAAAAVNKQRSTGQSFRDLVPFKGQRTTPKKKSMRATTALSPRQENVMGSPASIHGGAARVPLSQRNSCNNTSLSRTNSNKSLSRPGSASTLPVSAVAQRALQHQLAEELSAKAVLAHRKALQERANANISQRGSTADLNTTTATAKSSSPTKSSRPHVHFQSPYQLAQQIHQLSAQPSARLSSSRSTLNKSSSRSSLGAGHDAAVQQTRARRYGVGGYLKSDPVSRYHQFRNAWDSNRFLTNKKVKA